VQRLTTLAVKAQYQNISSLHIYSVSPTKLSELTTLSDIGRRLYADVFSKEDPLLHQKKYGVIQNPEVRRRKGKRPGLPVPTAPASKIQPAKDPPKPLSNPVPATLKREETNSRPSSRDSTSTRDTKPPALKRGSSGADIFKAFAKSQPPKPKAKSDSQDIKMSDAPTPRLEDDDEGESEDEALFLDNETRKPSKRASDVKKDREDKAAKLRKMMDSEDEDDAATSKDLKKGSDQITPDNVPQEDEEDVAWSNSDDEGKKEEATKQQPEEPKRKRGKKKVMKKRTTKDDDGYLVTKEEAVWESFSESDHEPAKKTSVLPNSSGHSSKIQGSQGMSQSSSASAKGQGKKGAANIMSFFGKK
jgi:DNA polymerase delta subunit 3